MMQKIQNMQQMLSRLDKKIESYEHCVVKKEKQLIGQGIEQAYKADENI